MAITREKKEAISKKLSSIAKNSDSIVFANFHGLSVGATTNLRQSLRENGVSYYVAKKSLIKKAFDAENFKGEMPELEGEIAVAWSENDALAPSREIFNFSKKHKKTFALVGGVYEGEYKSKEIMTEIASIPSIEVLRGMFVNVINSPIQRMAIALGQIAEKKA
ncbi:MAG TPA: 50S ribosomal protein L10 [Candidatus Paceibacterota bacterium]|nr:50S ribosomal protein L10 [Candidatus Paceibacterota bacterium]